MDLGKNPNQEFEIVVVNEESLKEAIKNTEKYNQKN